MTKNLVSDSHSYWWLVLCVLLQLCSISDAQEKCSDVNITYGEGLDDQCEAKCTPDSFETFDWAAPRESNDDILDRNWVCRCLAVDDLEEPTYECFDKLLNVFDGSGGVAESCSEGYNITSLSSCESFCDGFDPGTHRIAGRGDDFQCFCSSNPPIQICGPVSGGTTIGCTGLLTGMWSSFSVLVHCLLGQV